MLCKIILHLVISDSHEDAIATYQLNPRVSDCPVSPAWMDAETRLCYERSQTLIHLARRVLYAARCRFSYLWSAYIHTFIIVRG
jgi:hypothetical protein